MKTENVKGFSDYTGEEAEKREFIKEIIKGTFERYGFQPAETPVIEYEDFVKGSEEQQDDEAISDIYKLEDKGKRKLALRYEFTFQLKRLMKNKKLPYRRYQFGPVFRDEPIKENRTRQFVQCDADIVGSTTKDEADLISCMSEIFSKLKIDNTTLINSRKLLNEILKEQGVKDKDITQVIREIDKIDKLPEKQVEKNLEKFRAEKTLAIFKKPESYFKEYNSYKEIEELKKYCGYYGVKSVFAPYLARGLSYYNGTVFEVKTKKINETICAGGAYMFNGAQSFGISASLERLSAVTKIKLNLEKYLVVSLNKDKEAIALAKKLRKKGKSVNLYYGKPSKALEYANSYKINRVVFVGEKEVEKRKFRVKIMSTGKETMLKI